MDEEMIRVRAIRPFVEPVPGHGMLVFNTAKDADAKRGIEARKATEGDLPASVAEERIGRGFCEAIGPGAASVKKTVLDRRRERMLRNRADRRAARADGQNVAQPHGHEGEGSSARADNERDLRVQQDAIANGDELERQGATADGAQVKGGAAAEKSRTEPAKGDVTGDGASFEGPKEFDFRKIRAGTAEDADETPKPKAKRTRKARGKAAPRKSAAKPAAAPKAAPAPAAEAKPAPAATGGETAVATDAPVE